MDWMKVNCNSNAASQHHIPWKILFPFGVWAIWLHKNKLVFNPHLFLAQDKVLDTCVAKTYEFFAVSGTSSLPRPFHFVLVSWHILPPSWVKLSTEGFSLGNPRLARVGGLICNHNGFWICGFDWNVGYATSVLAELWVLKDGLTLVTSLGFSNVLIKLDSLIVLSFFNHDSVIHPCLMNIVNDCISLLLQISNYKMSHIFREGNKCADAMARLGGSLSPDFVLYSSPHDCIKDLLSFDLSPELVFVLSSPLGRGSGLFLFYQKREWGMGLLVESR